MSGDFAPPNLTNHFLIAMPALKDGLFGKSVVYVCEHNARGAMGLVINKPMDMTIPVLFDKVNLPLQRIDLGASTVLQGGPVQRERGFVLHEPAQEAGNYAATLHIEGGLQMTTSKDVLEALSRGAGPGKVLITLGYAAWHEGQLEGELGSNSWLTVPADHAVIFNTPIHQRYHKAMALLGLEPWMISPEVGHA